MEYNSVIFQILTALILVVYAVILFRSRLKPRVVRLSALVILLCGMALNFYALTVEGFLQGVVSKLGRSFFLSARMFVYIGDVFEFTVAQRSPYFLDLYYVVFYSAMLTSTSAILMLFGKRAMTLLTLFFRRKKFKHVFIGVNRRSLMIAQGLQGSETVFIDFNSGNEASKMSLNSLLKGLSGSQKGENMSRGSNFYALMAKRNLGEVESDGNVFATIGLDRLKKLTDSQTVFYILSEDSDRNLYDMLALLKDDDLMKNMIHVCISKEGVARYYKTILKQTGVHFIYPSSMAVVELMKDSRCHPVEVLPLASDSEGNPTGSVSGAFNSLVVGFGETGQAVVKFLYEFTALVGPDGEPVPADITVYDERMDSLLGPFMFDNPVMCNSGIIHFGNIGTESSEFWNMLGERLDSLNYIAISMNDEATSLDLACTIAMYAMKNRKGGLKGLRIVVRKKVTLPHERKLIDKMNERAGYEAIICYGEYDKVFTPEMVISSSGSGINKSATSLADRIAQAYLSVSGNAVTMHSNAESFHVKNRARMELHQMISRSNHLPSLTTLLGDTSRELAQNTMLILAKMEHLRYSRYLTAHGYSYGAEDDDVFKTNHQICGWDSLTEADRNYHMDMVRAELELLNRKG